jgi:hypothetical protein
MFADVINLEFKKQRKVFLSGLLLAGIVLFFIFAESIIRHRDFLEVFRDIIPFFALYGIAGLMILIGPVAGSQLRAESIRNAEEPLPFSPVQKVFGAYSTSLFYVLIGTLLFCGLVPLVNSFSTIDLSLLELGIVLMMAVQFHLLAFLSAYWINQAIGGVGVAALIVGSEIGVLILIRMLRDVFMFSYRESSWLILILCGIVVGVIGGFVGLSILAKRIERSSRTFFLPGFIVTMVAFAGSIFLFATFCFSSYKLQNQLVPSNLSWPTRFIEAPNLETSKAFFVSMSGDIVEVTPQKRIVLKNTEFRLDPNNNLEIIAGYFSGSSTFFLFKKEAGKYEIWKASNDGKFEKYLSFSSKIEPGFMFGCNDSTCLYSNSYTEKFIVFSKISSDFKQNQTLEWQRIPIAKDSYGFPTMLENEEKPQLESGYAARLSNDKRTLTRFLPGGKTVQWNLPGVAATRKFLGTIVLPAYEKNGEPYFVIPVSTNNKSSFVECLPDGSMKSAWNDSWPSTDEAIPKPVGGGVMWVRSMNKTAELRAVTNDGKFYGPIVLPTNPLQPWLTPLRIDRTEAWIIYGKELLKIDLINKKVVAKYSPLHERDDYSNNYLLNPTKDGVYFVRENRIGLIDWNGKILDLGPASVN